MLLKCASRILLLLSIIFLSAPAVRASSYVEWFDYPDGGFPVDWTWTGDPRGGGSFAVYDGTFTHVSGGYVHYIGPRTAPGRLGMGANFDFDVKGAHWIFAFRITPEDPLVGRSVWIAHSDLWGSWGYTLAEFSWENLDPATYPDGHYMWHNGAVLRAVHYPTEGPLEGWHHVSVDDTEEGDELILEVDGEEIFRETYEFIAEGYQGFGYIGEGATELAFDNLFFSWPSPAEASSWTRIKVLYR